jgi:hypothetical protein
MKTKTTIRCEKTTASTFAASWQPCLEETFWEMLGCLPPAYHKNGAFLVGEPSHHRRCRVSGAVRATYQGYRDCGCDFQKTSTAVTQDEFLEMLKPLT